MPTDDQQILVTGTASTPASFTVPGNGQITPRAVFASFDGTGAAGAFLPALKVISDGGETVGVYPCDTQVAAGASADVSWFPWLASGGGGTTTTSGAFALGVQTVAQTISANSSQFSTFGTALTSDSSVLTWSTTTFPNDTLTVNGSGVVQCFASMLWNVGQADADITVMVPVGFNALRHNAWVTQQPSLVTIPPGISTHMDQIWLNNPGGTPALHVGLSNGSAFDNGPQGVTFGAILLAGFEAF